MMTMPSTCLRRVSHFSASGLDSRKPVLARSVDPATPGRNALRQCRRRTAHLSPGGAKLVSPNNPSTSGSTSALPSLVEETESPHSPDASLRRAASLALVAGAAVLGGAALPSHASTAERVAGALLQDGGPLSMYPFLVPLILAALPLIELRGAIPVGVVVMGMDPASVFALAVLGNMLPVPFLILGFEPLRTWASGRSKSMKNLFDWLFERSRRAASRFKEGSIFAALVAFVGVPLPGTGAWSGSLICSVLGLPFLRGLLANFLGVVIAAVAVTALTLLGQWGWIQLH